ncbi:MAG: hypothetical protein IPJ03_17390 [Ignavibacteriales bacterium]|nr:hypothetical protein [Ignavibacteriales bacterium]
MEEIFNKLNSKFTAYNWHKNSSDNGGGGEMVGFFFGPTAPRGGEGGGGAPKNGWGRGNKL